MMNLLQLAFIFIIATIIQAKVIEIENGKISGVEYEKYFAYKGIKYATAKRFSLSKPNDEKWKGIRELNDYGESCAQYDFLYTYSGVEDCLFLNVFVPKTVLESKIQAPVVFYIHGGAFMFGAGSFYLPEHIMDNGKMILVTINYRVGILGFLSTEDEALPGNLGLKDQVEALKWVQRNIKAFNGNPNRVTIVGYSAGGASVQLHYLSPLSDGLFKNGISHSGVALNPWVFMENARDKAHKVAEYVNCPYDDHAKMVQCLRQKPVKELVNLAKKFQPFLYSPFSPFGAVIEPVHELAFLSEHPRILLQKGKFNHRPWLLSQTKDEGLYPGAEFYSKDEYLNQIDENWDDILPYILHYNDETSENDKLVMVSQMIREFYMGDKKICRENFASFIDILTDRLFKFNAFEAIQLQSKYSPTYFYHFGYKSLSGLGEALGNTTDYLGISHGEDVLLIFTHNLRQIEYSIDEKRMAQNLINMYYEFSIKNEAKFDNELIEPSFSDAIQSLEIESNEKYSMKIHSEKFGNFRFWKKIENLLHSNEKKFNDEL